MTFQQLEMRRVRRQLSISGINRKPPVADIALGPTVIEEALALHVDQAGYKTGRYACGTCQCGIEPGMGLTVASA